MTPKMSFDCPDEAIEALAARLTTVGIETAPEPSGGRTLAAPIVADRDSPAADVSAMDGYAVCLENLRPDVDVPVTGESAPGGPPPEMIPGSAVRIFTGAIVPEGAEVVIKREETVESAESVRFLPAALSAEKGLHIRRAGENAKASGEVLDRGRRIDAASRATMVNFGAYQADLFSPVRVSVLTSGNEVGLFQDQPPRPWQLRNSNRFAITTMLSQPWLEVTRVEHGRDDAGSLRDRLGELLEVSDAVLLTGGVSMGDYDYVPDVIRAVGGDIAFHGLPVRPGKPILGAATESGKLILGLPGNPVSATVGCRRFAMPLLARMGGQKDWKPACPVVHLRDGGDKTIPLHWMRLVRLVEHGVAEPIVSMGSGDLVSLGQSSGFVELPPNRHGEGPWPYYAW